MVDPFLLLAVALLVVGVVGSVVPGVPGAAASLAGVYLYWWSTGFGPPGVAFVAVVTVVGLLAMSVEYLGGAVAATVGGAGTWTVAAAGLVGLLALFVTGPVGSLLGVVLTVFAVEVYRGADLDAGARTAVVTAVGILASNVVQVLLNGTILVGFLVVVLA